MKLFLIRGWDPILPGCRWRNEVQVGVSTPCGSVPTWGAHLLFIPGLLGLYIYGIISDPAMGLYPPRAKRRAL